MIFSSIGRALKDTVTRPYLLLPFAVVTIISALVWNLILGVYDKAMSDILLYSTQLTEMNLFAVVAANYLPDLLMVVGAGLLMIFLGLIAALSLARVVEGEKFVKAINDSMNNWGRALALTAVAFLFIVIFAAAMICIDALSNLSAELAWVLLAILGIIMFIAWIKLGFAIPAAVKSKPKEALANSWEFTNDKFWKTFVFVIIAIIVTGIISLIFQGITILTDPDYEWWLMEIAGMISSTFFILAMAHYYNAE